MNQVYCRKTESTVDINPVDVPLPPTADFFFVLGGIQIRYRVLVTSSKMVTFIFSGLQFPVPPL